MISEMFDGASAVQIDADGNIHLTGNGAAAGANEIPPSQGTFSIPHLQPADGLHMEPSVDRQTRFATPNPVSAGGQSGMQMNNPAVAEVCLSCTQAERSHIMLLRVRAAKTKALRSDAYNLIGAEKTILFFDGGRDAATLLAAIRDMVAEVDKVVRSVAPAPAPSLVSNPIPIQKPAAPARPLHSRLYDIRGKAEPDRGMPTNAIIRVGRKDLVLGLGDKFIVGNEEWTLKDIRNAGNDMKVVAVNGRQERIIPWK